MAEELGPDEPAKPEPRGLHNKYVVLRIDATDAEPGGKHHGCETFVLDVTHDSHARKAVARYAQSVQRENPALASDLRQMLVRLSRVDTYR